MVRWFVMCARGVLAVHRYLVSMMFFTPSRDRASAMLAPAGPEPIMTTSVSTIAEVGTSVSSIPSLKTAMGLSTFSLGHHCLLHTLKQSAPQGDSLNIGGEPQ